MIKTMQNANDNQPTMQKVAEIVKAADAFLTATGHVCGVENQRKALIAALNLFPQL